MAENKNLPRFTKNRRSMAERPIIYQTPMVQAILDDRKTKTRRVNGLEFINESPELWAFESVGQLRTDDGKFDQWGATFKHIEFGSRNFVKCPYGQPGDLLWVRETLRQNGELSLEYLADCEWIDEDIVPETHKPYRNYAHCKIPSIHMPKWASRIWLEITDITVERLNDISCSDAEAEGITIIRKHKEFTEYQNYTNPQLGYFTDPRISFSKLWTLINGEDSWSLNPWVWVISFKVLSKTGRPVRKEAAYA